MISAFLLRLLMSSDSSFCWRFRSASIVARGTIMNLQQGKSAWAQGPSEHLRFRDAHIFPTPLYVFTSLPIELISSMVNWRIRFSRSLAAVCCRETFKDRWDWTAVCWIWTRIFGVESFRRVGKRNPGESEPFSVCHRITWSWSTEGADRSWSDHFSIYSPADAHHLPECSGIPGLRFTVNAHCWWFISPRQCNSPAFFFFFGCNPVEACPDSTEHAIS